MLFATDRVNSISVRSTSRSTSRSPAGRGSSFYEQRSRYSERMLAQIQNIQRVLEDENLSSRFIWKCDVYVILVCVLTGMIALSATDRHKARILIGRMQDG